MDTPSQQDREPLPRSRKRYKRYLDSNEEHVVSARTIKRQKKRQCAGREHRSNMRSHTFDDNGESSHTANHVHHPNEIRESEAAIVSANSFETDQDERKIIPQINYRSSTDEECLNDLNNDDEDDIYVNDTAEDVYSVHSDNSFADSADDEPDTFDYSIYENWVMFESSNVTVWEVFSMIQAMSLRFKFSDEAQQSILEFSKILAGPKFKDLNTTKYSMEKVFNPPADTKSYVFYCPDCATVLRDPTQKRNLTGTESAACTECSKEYPLTMWTNYNFLIIDVEYQLRSILENHSIRQAINDNLKQRNTQNGDDNIISDVQNGSRYKNCDFINEKNTPNSIVLTMNVNIDGASFFDTSKSSLWPIQGIINEIPAKLRFKNFILAALWMTKSEPNPKLMNLYLRFFIKQVVKLMNEGISLKNDQGETITYFLMIFGFAVDTPARAILQNRIQFNGYYGCSWCYINGVYAQRAMKYPVTVDSEERSHEEYLNDLNTFEHERQFLKNRDHLKQRDRTHLSRLSRGCKGPSELTSLPGFDCVWGFPSEYLHAILLGVSKQLWEECINPQSCAYLEPSQRNIVEKRLISIQPPNEMHRLPRLLKDRAKWRGSEWRSWLLFYSIVCLIDILPNEILFSYMLFVKATNTLLGTDITADDLFQCEIDLIQFVGDCQIFYGESFMTFNVHSLLHLTESVRKNGPLWATSAFPFESQIGKLKSAVTGPKGVVEQISNRILQANTFKSRVSTMSGEKETWRFCKNIFNYQPLLRNYYRTKEAILVELVSGEREDSSGMKYKRCIYNDVVYHSTLYTRPKKVNNRIVQLHDDTVVEIEYFTVIETVCYLVGKKWDTSPFNKGVQLHHLHVVNKTNGDSIVVPITMVNKKLACLKIERVKRTVPDETEFVFPSVHDIYVCMLPNTMEVQ